jgi:hypothetical protein
LQRILGFDEHLIVQPPPEFINTFKIPKPSQWKIITSNQKKCWVCEKNIYSLLIWNEKIGNIKNLKVTKKSKKIILNTIKRIPFESNRPILYSFNNNWVGQEMHTISEYCLIIDNLSR